MGVEPESCGLLGGCHAQLVVEADGSAYPCDFYVTDSYRMGNIQESCLAELLSCETAKRFEQESYPPHRLYILPLWLSLPRRLPP